MNSNLKKKYVSYDPSTYLFMGFYSEGRKDMPTFIKEVDNETFLEDKGEHTHFNPNTEIFYTPDGYRDEEMANINRGWRNRELQRTDFYMLEDVPFTNEQKKEVQDYREALRHYPETWIRPTKPSWM